MFKLKLWFDLRAWEALILNALWPWIKITCEHERNIEFILSAFSSTLRSILSSSSKIHFLATKFFLLICELKSRRHSRMTTFWFESLIIRNWHNYCGNFSDPFLRQPDLKFTESNMQLRFATSNFKHSDGISAAPATIILLSNFISLKLQNYKHPSQWHLRHFTRIFTYNSCCLQLLRNLRNHPPT